MAELLNYKGGIVAGVFLLLFLMEHLRPAAPGRPRPLRRIAKNLAFWPLNIGLSLLVVLPVTARAADQHFWPRPDGLSGPGGLLIAILLLDIFLFWWHRALHEIPFLWRFHEVHHLDEHLDTTSAIRFHFGEIFFATFLRAAIIMLLGLPFVSVLLFEILVMAAALFHHSNITLPPRLEGLLARVIITPSLHWVHHHAVQRDTDSNYGTLFSFWDRLFGTKSATRRTSDMKIGVEGGKDISFPRLLIRPFWRQN